MMEPNPALPSMFDDDTDLPAELSVVLSDPRRGRVLAALTGGARSFDELADAVATAESVHSHDVSWESIRHDVAVSLYHRHLPKLSAEGLVLDGTDGTDGEVGLTTTGLACAEALGVDRESDV